MYFGVHIGSLCTHEGQCRWQDRVQNRSQVCNIDLLSTHLSVGGCWTVWCYILLCDSALHDTGDREWHFYLTGRCIAWHWVSWSAVTMHYVILGILVSCDSALCNTGYSGQLWHCIVWHWVSWSAVTLHCVTLNILVSCDTALCGTGYPGELWHCIV